MKYVIVDDAGVILQTTENDDDDTVTNRELVSARVVSGRLVFLAAGSEMPAEHLHRFAGAGFRRRPGLAAPGPPRPCRCPRPAVPRSRRAARAHQGTRC